jgi:hypothetical protein
MGAAPALAEHTAGVELAGEAEKAAAAKAEALISIVQNKAVRGREVEMPPQEGKRGDVPPPQKGKRMYEPPPEALLQKRECERARTSAEREPKVEEPARKGGPELEALLQGECMAVAPPQECEHMPSWRPREPSHDVVLSLSTWEGPDHWDPGVPTGNESSSRGPVEANKNDTTGIDACNETKETPRETQEETWPHKNQSAGTTAQKQPRTFPSIIVPSHRQEAHPFSF